MNLSILNSTILTTTRMPSSMAEDGYLSPFLARIHPKFGTPWLAIILSAAIYCLLAWHSVTQLISVYVWLRIATSVLTVLSAWQLRRTRPELHRSFRIPWGRAGLAYAVIAPLLMSGVAMIASDKFALKWGPVALLLGSGKGKEPRLAAVQPKRRAGEGNARVQKFVFAAANLLCHLRS